MTVTVDLEKLADAAREIAEQHPSRTRERRAAAHLYFSLTIPPAKTIDAARRAIKTYGTARTQAEALALFDSLLRRTP